MFDRIPLPRLAALTSGAVLSMDAAAASAQEGSTRPS